jgi:hypothetical protein
MTVAKGHGIEMRGMTDEVIQNHLDKVTVHYDGRDAVDDVRHNIYFISPIFMCGFSLITGSPIQTGTGHCSLCHLKGTILPSS